MEYLQAVFITSGDRLHVCHLPSIFPFIGGIFSFIYKISSITHVHKSGDPSYVTNYSLLSIIPHLEKLFVLIVYSKVKRRLNHFVIAD